MPPSSVCPTATPSSSATSRRSTSSPASGRRRSASRSGAVFRYVLCDVFTARALEGNPGAVFTDARELPEALLQPLARGLNLSETGFVLPKEGDGHVRS